ncbi:MAG: CofH family radical SAM protein [Chlamydiia bacterium]|nr:CofH family radical SAM protein [Chlamydiia bacterium]
MTLPSTELIKFDYVFKDSRLEQIAEAVFSGRRLTPEEGVTLLETEDLEGLQQLANWKRQQVCGDTVYYATTFYIHPTNLCELSCPLCSFYSKPGWKTAWFLKPEEAIEKISQHLDHGLTEIHVVGGLWRDCNLDYYCELFQGIHALDSNLHIKALTPVEYEFLADLHNIPVEEVFSQMMSWGLGSLPGGGAEILVESIRKVIAPEKISSERYLEIHKIAHQLGLPSNVTMLFGHIEENTDIVTHLCKVREVQDETGGFKTFVPLKFHIENNALGKRKKRIQPKDPRRVFAVSRLMLDNVRNLKVLWNYLGVELACELLDWGGNDLSSTNIEEKIIVMAGGLRSEMRAPDMERLIAGKGRTPMKIHSGTHHNH